MFIPLAVMIVKHFEDLNSTKALTFYCGSCTLKLFYCFNICISAIICVV